MLRSLLLATLVLSACGSPFEVELPDQAPRLVVQSLFAADSVLTLGVLQSAPSVASGGAPSDPVTTATVQIFQDGARVGSAVYDPSRRRYVSDVRPRAGRTIGVRVEAPGFEPVEAQDTVPRATPFEVEVLRGPEPGADRVDPVTVRLAAPADTAFLALYGLVERPGAGGEPDPVAPLSFRSSDPLLADGALGGLVFDFEEPFYQRAVFRVVPALGAELAVRINVRRAPDGTATERLRLATLSPTYYAYARALDAEGTGATFEAAQALPSNVSGGFGIFAAFAAAEQVLP